MIIPAALLANIVNAGTDALTLAEDMDEATFRRSRLARAEMARLVGIMATNLADLPDAASSSQNWTGAPGAPSPNNSAPIPQPATKPCGSPSAPWSRLR